ncbi:hypothetical protein OH77DRAFT_1152598 [Trametes cingulata]|nr:hypothetical protein OH77DRAFT_1152598 [Trametes cingulata]
MMAWHDSRSAPHQPDSHRPTAQPDSQTVACCPNWQPQSICQCLSVLSTGVPRLQRYRPLFLLPRSPILLLPFSLVLSVCLVPSARRSPPSQAFALDGFLLSFRAICIPPSRLLHPSVAAPSLRVCIARSSLMCSLSTCIATRVLLLPRFAELSALLTSALSYCTRASPNSNPALPPNSPSLYHPLSVPLPLLHPSSHPPPARHTAILRAAHQ